jgi:hypothetical protein
VRARTRSTMRMGARRRWLGWRVGARGCGARVRCERSQDGPYAPCTPLLLCVFDLAHAACAAADGRAAEAGADGVPRARVFTARKRILELGAREAARRRGVRAGPALRVRKRVLAGEQQQEREFARVKCASFHLFLLPSLIGAGHSLRHSFPSLLWSPPGASQYICDASDVLLARSICRVAPAPRPTCSHASSASHSVCAAPDASSKRQTRC